MATTIPSLAADPCGRAEALRAVKDQIITGTKAVETEFEAGNGTRRRAKFQEANMASLDREIAAADTACNLKNGARPRRFAIGGRP